MNLLSLVVTAASETATAESDFNFVTTTITIQADLDFYNLELNINDDLTVEPSEFFTLTLSEPSSGSITTATTTINILDNDAEPEPPADDAPPVDEAPPVDNSK